MLNTGDSLNIGPGAVQLGRSALRPWKHWIATLTVLACLAAFTGCTQRYVVMLSHGTVMMSDGKPKYDKATDSYVFTDTSGRKCAVRSSNIREIAPASMSEQAVPLKPAPAR